MNREERRAAKRRSRGIDPVLKSAWRAFERDDLREAQTLYERALERSPSHPDVLHMLGVLAHRRGEYSKAASLIGQAILLAPESARFQHNLAEAHSALGQLAKAIQHYERALVIKPDYAAAHNGLGAALFKRRHIRDAARHLEAALALEPDLVGAHINTGILLEATGTPAKALACYERAAELDPNHPELELNRANALLRCGDPIGAAEGFRRAVLARPADANTNSNLLLSLNYTPHDPHELFDEHRRWNDRHARKIEPLPPPSPDRDPSRRLRIGYLTPDLDRHSVGYFFRPLLEAHDPAAVETFCYTQTWKENGAADWLREGPEHWRDITALSDRDAAELIRDDAIDVLVDLAGHTAHHRLLVLAHRPAPVQATYCGYANTTGMSAVDFRITDADADPVGETERFHSERLVRLPGGFLCYQRHEGAPQPSAPPAEADGFVTFGSFNHLPKVTEQVIAIWARILGSVPSSRLLLKSMAFSEEGVCERFRGLFATRGVDPTRIDLHAWTASHREHLELYSQIDIALDTFPYAGTTTTCETLWMGVPIVTLAGETHVSRVGASLLNQIGLPELVAEGEDDYVETAVMLANDHDRAAEMRRTLRPRMESSPLCDADRIACEVEDAYRTMWQEYLRKAPSATPRGLAKASAG